eukprot:5024239-Ditylum_brightwellii.AAC.1
MKSSISSNRIEADSVTLKTSGSFADSKSYNATEIGQVASSFSRNSKNNEGIDATSSNKESESKPRSRELKVLEHQAGKTLKKYGREKLREWPWVVGLKPQWRQPWSRVGVPQQPQAIIWNYLLTESQNQHVHNKRVHKKDRDIADCVQCMAINKSESYLAAGNGRGEILLWDLRCHPPQKKSTFCCYEDHLQTGEHNDGIDNERNNVSLDENNAVQQSKLRRGEPIVQLQFLDRGSKGVACDGHLHLWDIETNQIVSSFCEEPTTKSSTGLGGMFSGLSEDFVGFDSSPVGTGIGEDIGSWGVTLGDIMGITSSRLYHIDMRCPPSDNHQCLYTQKASRVKDGIANHNPLYHNKTWYLSLQQNQSSALSNSTSDSIMDGHTVSKGALNGIASRKEPSSTRTSSFELTCVTLQCGGGNWVCVGSKSGHIHCFERRTGALLHCWKGHQAAVVAMEAITRHKLLTISRDKTGILWNLKSLPEPKKLFTIRGKESILLR